MPRSSGRETSRTRQKLVDTAEKLFAEQGVDNVTLADVARAAGQKNRSAMQYYFDGKTELIKAVLDKHAAAIEARRKTLLDGFEATGEYTLRDMVEALVEPLAQELTDAGSGRRYLRINSQLLASNAHAPNRLARARSLREVKRLQNMTADCLESVGADVLASRQLMIDALLFHGLAAYTSRGRGIDSAVFLDNLKDAIYTILAGMGEVSRC